MTDKYLFGINFTAFKKNMTAEICDFKECLGCPYFKGYDKQCLFHEFLEVTEKAAEVYDKTTETDFSMEGDVMLENEWVKLVKEFNKAYGVKYPTYNRSSIYTQMELIDEENNELYEAVEAGNDVEILDAIIDSIYVLIGLGLKLGYDLEGAFAEVHRSNLSKLGADGKPIYREDGKVLKGPNFTPPDLKPYIN